MWTAQSSEVTDGEGKDGGGDQAPLTVWGPALHPVPASSEIAKVN